MKKIIKNGAIFCIVVFSFYAFPLYVLIKSGEMKSLTQICDVMESNDEILLGLAYSDINQVYKLEETIRRKPKILALGTSRIMQISPDWFNTSFYNAGGGIVEPIDAIHFLEKLYEPPKLLIINLDQFFFNELSSSRFNANYQYNYEPFEKLRANAIRIYLDFVKGKFSLFDVSAHNIGLNACVNGNGFKQNGCYYYGSIITNSEEQVDYKFADCISRINKGDRRFEYGSKIDAQTVKDIEQLIKYCSMHNIKMIAFIPPFAPTVQKHIAQKGSSYTYMKEIYGNISGLFDGTNAYLYDFQYMNAVNSPDSEFVDGFHGSEATYLRMWLKIMEICELAQNYSKSRCELLDFFNRKEYRINYHK